MTVLNAHFEGKKLVLDDPVPDDLPPNARVRVSIEAGDATASEALANIARLATPLGLPKDFATNFKHYTKGAPKR